MNERTKSCVARRTAEGRSKLETIRCRKRYVAREVFALLRADLPLATTSARAAA